jgi:hypothetical protein
MENEILLKRCSKCKNEKSLTEFHKNRSLADGLCNQCKACKNSNNYIREVTCECGKTVLSNYLRNHLQTNIHIKRMQKRMSNTH